MYLMRPSVSRDWLFVLFLLEGAQIAHMHASKHCNHSSKELSTGKFAFGRQE
jgi:hypothetical protein